MKKARAAKVTGPYKHLMTGVSYMLPIVVAIVAMGLVPQPLLATGRTSVDRLVARMQAAEQRMRQADPSLPQMVGTEPAALAFARPPAVPAPTPEAPPAGGAAPAPGSH